MAFDDEFQKWLAQFESIASRLRSIPERRRAISYYITRQDPANPVPVYDWNDPRTHTQLMEMERDPHMRTVGAQQRWTLAGYTGVWTSFIMVDHGWQPEAAPVLWETMVFGCHPLEDEQLRYDSYEKARLGHRVMVRAWLSVEPDWPEIKKYWLKVWKRWKYFARVCREERLWPWTDALKIKNTMIQQRFWEARMSATRILTEAIHWSDAEEQEECQKMMVRHEAETILEEASRASRPPQPSS